MTNDTPVNISDMKAGVRAEPVPTDKMLEIVSLISDPHTPVSEISRAIAGELASISSEMSCISESKGYRLKILSERTKSLRELSKTLVESEVLSKKDSLNFDGPKFQFVFQEITANFKKAMKESGIQEAAANEVLRNFRDIMSTKELDLRKQVEKVEAVFTRK